MTDLERAATPVRAARHTRDLAGRHILFLNWRDPAHPEAGGAETYCWETAREFSDAGALVEIFAAAVAGRPAGETIDGIRIVRRGGRLGVYLCAAIRLKRRPRFDAVVDCQNGIPFFSPLFAPKSAIVLLVHHVHQDQFGLHLGRGPATVGRLLEGPVSRWVYRHRPVVAVSPSTRAGVRRRLGLRGPIFVVPNGMAHPPVPPGGRSPAPTIVSVGRLVRHKRYDLLVRAAGELRDRVPGLQVDLIGGGPETGPLRALIDELSLGDVVHLRGRLEEADKRARLAGAWLQVQPSAAEGWGLTVLEGNALGVPCLAYDVPGLRDAVRPGETGWLVPAGEPLAPAIATALETLAPAEAAARWRNACRAWAARFDWATTADRLAGVVIDEIRSRERMATGLRDRRRSDLVCAVEVDGCDEEERARLRRTVRANDTVVEDGDTVHVLLYGSDERGAAVALARAGLSHRTARMRVATNEDLLVPGWRARREP